MILHCRPSTTSTLLFPIFTFKPFLYALCQTFLQFSSVNPHKTRLSTYKKHKAFLRVSFLSPTLFPFLIMRFSGAHFTISIPMLMIQLLVFLLILNTLPILQLELAFVLFFLILFLLI